MKYMCMAYEEEAVLDALSRQEWDSLRRETIDYVDELQRSGRLILSEPLQSVRTAATVRVRDGRTVTTDGPFAETKETLGGFFLIEARDLNEAIEVASRWPSARIGSIEVRPLEAGLSADRRYH
ncbi:MAG TPA: YciI family protein [Candidatus Binatia bacterium]|nr:YciI family protein [Candidatus Binatia bacterium]